MTDTPLQIRNSTAEFLIFTAQAGEQGIEVRFEDETVWLTQKMMAELFQISVPTINEHLKNIFGSAELDKDSVVRKFRTTAADGKRYKTQTNNLDASFPPMIRSSQPARPASATDQSCPGDIDMTTREQLKADLDEVADSNLEVLHRIIVALKHDPSSESASPGVRQSNPLKGSVTFEKDILSPADASRASLWFNRELN
jgi:hypothetical protein